MFPLKATFHSKISMRGQREVGQIQRNNRPHVQCGSSLTGKTSSVYLISHSHSQKIADGEVAFTFPNRKYFDLTIWFKGL